MLGRRQKLNLQFLQIVDAFLLVASFWSAHWFRFNGHGFGLFDSPILPFSEFQWLLFVLIPFGPICLHAQGFYEHAERKTVGRSLGQLGRAAIFLGLIIALSAYFFKLRVDSRAVMPIFAAFATVLILVREWITVGNYRRAVRSGRIRERVLLVGTAADMLAFRSTLTPSEIMEIEMADDVDITTRSMADFVESVHQHTPERVIFVGSHGELGRLQEYIGACETEGVESWLSADFMQTAIARPDFDHFGGRPMLVFRTAPSVSWALFLKHLFDRVIAVVIVAAFSWLFVIIALAIKLTSKGPVIFRQARGGKNGRPFSMFKFRTMRTDAEMQREELQRFNVMSGPVFKVENDPRVTAIGRFLRKTSLDELPQLFNVLLGDMSLVGPRPLPMYEVERIEATAHRRRLSMKPGITCLWQISGRNNVTSFDRWVALDLEYIDNWSPLLDVRILLKTIPVVLFGWGAK
ncbi:UDP-phosphate galactose phosphotransferase [Verrucomicrobiota bacterium]|nr:UDP-phosphate galactose phosphotransferase [Verrucomicrobiota bacterium]